MPYSTNLKIDLMDNGTNSTTWGTVTNVNLGTALEQAIVGKADISMSSTTVTLTYTDTNAAQNARAIYLNLSGSPGGAADLVVPAIQKPYIVKNGSDEQVTIKVSGQTGVVIPVGKTVLVYNNGTDVVTSVDHIPSLTLASALPVASGGTGITAFGTGVATALGVNTGSAGAFVVNGGALGTPSSGTLTSATGLPVSTGIAGLGTNVATALAVNVGSAGAVVVNGGALGTPSSGTLTSATGLPVSTGISGLGTNVATALAVNVGSAGAFVVNGGALGTPSGGTLTSCTGLPVSTGVSGLGTGVATALGQNVTGSGGIVLATSPTLTTPTLTSPTVNTLLTVSGDSSLNGAVVVNESGADKDFRVEGDTDSNLLFVDASTDRVGIGTNSPGARLEVRENTSCFSTVSTALNSFTVHVLDPGTGSPPGSGATTLTSTSARLTIDAAQLNALCVYNTDVSSGFGQRDVYVAPVSGALGYLSSLRGRKTNIESIADVSWLYELNPVSFYYKKQVDGVSKDEPEGLKQLGLIAEEVEQVRPELCFYDFVEGEEPTLRGVSYSSLITPLLKAVQQLKEELNSAKARIAALESQRP